jgi:type IV pilus assembly protein PilB
MPRIDIDNLLAELGAEKPGPDAPLRRPKPEEPEPSRPKAKTDAPPSRPAGKDPPRMSTSPYAPPLYLPTPAPEAPAREALSELYKHDAPEAGAPGSGGASAAELGQVLLQRGVVTPQQLQAAVTILKQSPHRRMTEVLVEQGADDALVQQTVADLANVAFERIDLSKGLDGGFDGKLLQRLGADFCKEHMVIPLRGGETPGGRVVIGGVDPSNVFLVDEVRRRLGAGSVKLVLVPAFDIKGALEIVGTSTAQAEENLSEILADVSDNDVEVETRATGEAVDLEAKAGESPVIRIVNKIIQTAVNEGASDIHIEPAEKKLRVRYRIDGELYEMLTPPASMAAAITSRLKIMANLDISERRIPQDGRIRCTVQGRKLDLRVSTIPCAGASGGEKTVMRLLDTRSINVDLEDLGFDENTLLLWKKQVEAPHGITLVTGPTGSGKTTTLYASLRTLDKNSMNISTVEDPVEYHLDGITQTQMHEKIGMTFAKALKSLLRQDPDVIMLGEIRDLETAHTAVQAALTGHLVLSTLHTNDAPGSITRLVNIGLEPFLVGAAINGVLAQRLIRRLCKECKVQGSPTDERREFLTMQGMDPDGVFLAKGCGKCRNTGYSGRVGIYELLCIDDQIRDTIARNPNVSEFRRMCIERGMVTLRDDGMKKVAKGVTTVEEVLRVSEGGH